jgi:DNA-binding NtrC family response regulator
MSHNACVVGLIEDDPVMGESLVQRLALEGITVKWWQRGRDALKDLATFKPQAIICDIRLPDLDGEALFRHSVQTPDAPPFMFITGHGDIDQAVRLMRAGAADYITKPFEMDDFLLRLAELTRPVTGPTSSVLGVSLKMRDVERLLLRVAKTTSTILISGETGTGKEVAARFLHATSPAASSPFMAVNCSAIPHDLLESELFGHEKGAFSGAVQRHLGYAERTGHGILFLDEIGELRLELQAKLLRLIEDRIFHRVGGERALPFSGRIVAATNAKLSELVAQKRFRDDLYYRINVVAVDMPPLRERAEDIPWLIETFFAEFASQSDTQLKGVSALAIEAAIAHTWPGNVRELRNRMERAVALSLGQWIMPGDLLPEYADVGPVEQLGSLEDARQGAEKRHILRALSLTNGELSAASKLLGIGRTTLWEKMRRLDLNAEE